MVNLKITPEFNRVPSTPPDYKKRNKVFNIEIPVTETKRMVCKTIQQTVLANIDAGIQRDKDKAANAFNLIQSARLAKIDNLVREHKPVTREDMKLLKKAGKPFQDLKVKLNAKPKAKRTVRKRPSSKRRPASNVRRPSRVRG